MQHCSRSRRHLAALAASILLVMPAAAAAQAEAEQARVEELVVYGAAEGYRVDSARGILKSGASLLETPRSVSVVTRQLIEEQASFDLHDTFRNVAGLNQQNFNGDFNIRGFRANGGPDDASVLYDGLRGHPGTFTHRPTLSNLERVEVLKGPGSVLHGTLNPGGVINLVSKRPREKQNVDLSARFGSFERAGAGVDATGSLSGDGAVQYRLVADWLEHESHKNFIDVDQTLLQPAIAWEPTDSTRLDLIYLYSERDARGERRRGTPDIEGDFFALPDDFTYNEPGDVNNVEIQSLTVLLDHRFNEDLRLDAGVRYFEDESVQAYHEPRGAEPTFDDPVVDRSFRDQLRESEALQAQVSLSTALETGPVAHELTLGGDWYQLETDGDFSRARGPQVPGLNVLDPVHDAPGKAGYDLQQNALRANERTLYGAFLRDRLQFGPQQRWYLNLGVRYDAFEDEAEDLLRGITAEDSDNAVSLSAGLLYQWRPETSFYASYSEGFVPQGVSDQADPRTGGPFDPEESWQVELGAKRSWDDDRLVTSLALFSITKENFLVSDPTDPDGFRLLELGEVQSQGVELEGVGRLSDRLSITFNFSFQNAEIEQTSPAQTLQEGDPPERGTPEESGAFWLRWDLPESGFSLAVGPNYVGARPNPGRTAPGDDETIPSFVVWDALLAWRHRTGLAVELKINNFTDQDHFSGGGFGDRWGYQRGAPLNAVATLRYGFGKD